MTFDSSLICVRKVQEKLLAAAVEGHVISSLCNFGDFISGCEIPARWWFNLTYGSKRVEKKTPDPKICPSDTQSMLSNISGLS